jgi:hypothetical protein
MMLLLSSLNAVLLLVTALCNRISYSTGLGHIADLKLKYTRYSNDITLQCDSRVRGIVEANFYRNSELQASLVRDYNFIITSENEGSYHCEVGGDRSESKSIRCKYCSVQ